jgi:hypothetical protein
MVAAASMAARAAGRVSPDAVGAASGVVVAGVGVVVVAPSGAWPMAVCRVVVRAPTGVFAT